VNGERRRRKGEQTSLKRKILLPVTKDGFEKDKKGRKILLS